VAATPHPLIRARWAARRRNRAAVHRAIERRPPATTLVHTRRRLSTAAQNQSTTAEIRAMITLNTRYRTEAQAMTTYTVRERGTLRPVTDPAATLTEAIDALEIERAAHQLNPPPGRRDVELVITADELDAARPGDIIVRYAAGQQLRPGSTTQGEQTF
jgi:hypothetical protein